MKLKNIDYTFKIGLKALRVLQDEFKQTLEEIGGGTASVVKLTYCGLKGYNKDFSLTIDEVEDEMDSNLALLIQANEAVANFYERFAEAAGEAKN